MVINLFLVAMLFLAPTVRSVTITGNQVVTEKELRSAMLLRGPRLFFKSTFHPELLVGDVDALRTVYMKHGFLEPTISSSYTVDSTNKADINISVKEGKQTFIKSIVFSGNTIFTGDELKSDISIREGIPFNPFQLENEYFALINRYDRRGFHDARVAAEVSIPENAEITFAIREGERILIGEINVEGADHINRGRIDKIIGLKTATILTNEKIGRARKRLYDLNLFSKIRVREDVLNQERGITFAVETKEPISVHLRLGYSVLDGPKTTIAIKHNNFLHSLRIASITGKVSLREQGVEMVYRDPILMGVILENGFGMRVEQSHELGFRIRRYGGNITVIPRPISVRYEIERVRVFEVEIDTLVQEGVEWLRILSIGYVIDRRDNQIMPSRGYLLSGALSFSGIVPKATSNFVKAEFRYRVFQRAGPITVGCRCDVGLAKPIAPTVRIPIHSRFFLGGATTIRGYEERSIGDTDHSGNPLGGERYILMSLETRIPLFLKFALAVFTDIGSLEQDVAETSFDLKMGAGAGMRLYTPLGAFRFDYARNMEGGHELHFAIGEAF
jgi:outer membrane protein insertion porin family